MIRALLTAVTGPLLGAAVIAPAYACDNACNPCDPEKERWICHNIGGPRDHGANCDMTGTCTYPTTTGNVTVSPNHFLGIIIGFNQANTRALGAHIGHGDGPIEVEFNPPLHLAATAGPHFAVSARLFSSRSRLDLRPPWATQNVR